MRTSTQLCGLVLFSLSGAAYADDTPERWTDSLSTPAPTGFAAELGLTAAFGPTQVQYAALRARAPIVPTLMSTNLGFGVSVNGRAHTMQVPSEHREHTAFDMAGGELAVYFTGAPGSLTVHALSVGAHTSATPGGGVYHLLPAETGTAVYTRYSGYFDTPQVDIAVDWRAGLNDATTVDASLGVTGFREMRPNLAVSAGAHGGLAYMPVRLHAGVHWRPREGVEVAASAVGLLAVSNPINGVPVRPSVVLKGYL